MKYYNPVFRIGLDKFFGLAKECMIDGIIVPDLPIEEAGGYKNTANKFGIDPIFLAAPSTSNERLASIVESSSGFLYLVSHFGVTGAKAAIEDSTLELVKRVLLFTSGKIPLAVGFGVSKPEHVRRIIKAGADGVIVGSTFINLIKTHQKNIDVLLKDLQATASELKKATQNTKKKFSPKKHQKKHAQH